jgi:hypothetical protein
MTDIIEEPGTTTEPVEQVESNEIVEQSEPTTEPPVEEIKQDKLQKRFDELTREKYEARRRAEEARQEVEQLRQQLNSNSSNDNIDIDQIVNQRAYEIAQEKTFNDACNKVYEKGASEFKDFDKAVANLQLVGMNREFLELVSMSDIGEKILYTLGQDFEQAERFANMPPLQMARELTKLEIKLSDQKKKVSSAPEPISTISGKSTGTKSPAEMTDDEYAKWRRQGR